MHAPFNSKIISIIGIITALNIGLLIVRITITQEPLFLFLVWNLFLAAIPLIIAAILYEHTRIAPSKLRLWFLGVVWLLFLPNAFYLLTDLKHLKHATDQLVLLDALLLFSFAFNGVLMGFFAMYYGLKSIRICYLRFPVGLGTLVIFFLCGFGIYLGRELRWNSWDVLANPTALIQDIFTRIMNPLRFIRTWGITLIMAAFLSINYYIFKQFFMLKKTRKHAAKN